VTQPEQYAFWAELDAIGVDARIAPPPYLRSASHAKFRAIHQYMHVTCGFTGPIEIDWMALNEGPAGGFSSIKIRWAVDSCSSAAGNIIVIATSGDVTAGTPITPVATVSGGESTAYADGGDRGGQMGTGGAAAATARVSAPKCWAYSYGGQCIDLSAGSGGAATSTTNNSESTAAAYGGDFSKTGGTATANSTGSQSDAFAYGGESRGVKWAANRPARTIGNKGGNATASSTRTTVAAGGKGAPNKYSPNVSGDGGDATVNNASASTSETATEGAAGAATGEPGNMATAGSAGTPTTNQ